MAKLAHFYGWTHCYISKLPYRIASQYFEAITVIEAQDRLIDLNVADYPKMTEDGRKKYHRNMRKMAHPEGMQKETSFDDFIGKMKNGR